MAIVVDRYSRSPILDGGTRYGTSYAHVTIRNAIADGTLSYRTDTVRGRERLDTIAGYVYGDSRYWWIIAAASGIGWGLQVPPDTVITIPNLNQALELIE